MAVQRQHGAKNFNKKWALTEGDFKFILECESHNEEIMEALGTAVIKGLTECGMVAEGHAKKNLTANRSVDTGRLRNSITFRVNEDEDSVSIGTNVEYAVYVECGTGKHYEGPEGEAAGRPSKWSYTDEQGNTHWTGGNRAKPYLKPAVADHEKTYIALLNKACKDG